MKCILKSCQIYRGICLFRLWGYDCSENSIDLFCFYSLTRLFVQTLPLLSSRESWEPQTSLAPTRKTAQSVMRMKKTECMEMQPAEEVEYDFCKVKYWLSLTRPGQGRSSGISKQASCRGLWKSWCSIQTGCGFPFWQPQHKSLETLGETSEIDWRQIVCKTEIKLWDFLPQGIVGGEVVSRFKGLDVFLGGRSRNE